MESKLKKKRLQNIIKRIEYIMESGSDMDLILSDKDLKVLEAVLGVRPYSKRHSKQEDKKEIKKISCHGLKKKRKSSCK